MTEKLTAKEALCFLNVRVRPDDENENENENEQCNRAFDIAYKELAKFERLKELCLKYVTKSGTDYPAYCKAVDEIAELCKESEK